MAAQSTNSDNEQESGSSISLPPAPRPPLGISISTTVTHASSPSNFHINSSPHKLKELESELVRTGPPPADMRVKPGGYCAAKFHADSCYYRALVLEEAEEKDHWRVMFVDYGNIEVASAHDLVPLKEELQSIPMTAFPCQLYGVKPVGDEWSFEASKMFSDAVLDRSVSVTLKVYST